jgi:catechol 2,3-dioxygenase-like lactoylglutathione lyase family enzyme
MARIYNAGRLAEPATAGRGGSMKFRTHFTAVLTAIALVTLGGPAPEPTMLAAQAPAPSSPGIRNVSILHLNVADMDRALAWYQGVLGMKHVRDNGGPSPTQIVAEKGAMMHTVILETPGKEFSMELVEVSGVPLRPQQRNVQDPGAVMLAVVVSDLDAVLAGASKLGLKVISTDGKVVVTEARGRQAMVRDADGFVSYLSQATEPNAAAIRHEYTFIAVDDMVKTVTFYNEVFGMTLDKPGDLNPTGARILGLVGNPALSRFRLTTGYAFPDTPGKMRFQEFAGAPKNAVRHRVQDPGGPILTMSVDDFAGVMQRVQRYGGTIGDGDTSAQLAPDARVSWIRDPNGLLIRVAKTAPARGN